MPALSTNKSGFGYRGDHQIATSSVDFTYQIEAAFAITSSPGLNTSSTQQSNVVKSGLGYGDSFVGFGHPFNNEGAIALPVIWISQVITSWVVPPKRAMELA